MGSGFGYHQKLQLSTLTFLFLIKKHHNSSPSTAGWKKRFTTRQILYNYFTLSLSLVCLLIRKMMIRTTQRINWARRRNKKCVAISEQSQIPWKIFLINYNTIFFSFLRYARPVEIDFLGKTDENKHSIGCGLGVSSLSLG